jgi:hypothetical protein
VNLFTITFWRSNFPYKTNKQLLCNFRSGTAKSGIISPEASALGRLDRVMTKDSKLCYDVTRSGDDRITIGSMCRRYRFHPPIWNLSEVKSRWNLDRVSPSLGSREPYAVIAGPRIGGRHVSRSIPNYKHVYSVLNLSFSPIRIRLHGNKVTFVSLAMQRLIIIVYSATYL